MVPFINGVVDVQPLVALQPDQLRIKPPGQRPRNLRLAHAGLPLQKQGAAQLQRQKDGNRQPPVGNIILVAQQPQHFGHRLGNSPALISKNGSQQNPPGEMEYGSGAAARIITYSAAAGSARRAPKSAPH